MAEYQSVHTQGKTTHSLSKNSYSEAVSQFIPRAHTELRIHIPTSQKEETLSTTPKKYILVMRLT